MYRVGVIGCGRWGKIYIRVLSEIREAHVEHVADLDPATLQAIRQRYPDLNASLDWRAITRAPHLDAVVVATNASSHFSMAADALEEGKHVIVEKPMCLNLEQCELLTALAERQRRVLLVGHIFLYNDSVRKMRELLQQPDSGAVHYVTARRTHLGTIRDDVSVLWDLAAHDISIFAYLLDRQPLSVSAVGCCYVRAGREDVAFVTLFYPGGITGHIHVSWVDANKQRSVSAVTTRRGIVFNDLDNLESLRVIDKGITLQRNTDSFGEFQYLVRDGDVFSPRFDRREPLKNLCTHFIECIRDGRPPLTDGKHGASVVRVLQAADKSIARRGQEVDV